jgi:hypothetical protein
MSVAIPVTCCSCQFFSLTGTCSSCCYQLLLVSVLIASDLVTTTSCCSFHVGCYGRWLLLMSVAIPVACSSCQFFSSTGTCSCCCLLLLSVVITMGTDLVTTTSCCSFHHYFMLLLLRIDLLLCLFSSKRFALTSPM